MGNERESDEGERDFEEVHGEEADIPSSEPGRGDESDVIEVGGAGDLDELDDIDEVERPSTAEERGPEQAERRDREGQQQDRGRGRDQGRGDRQPQQQQQGDRGRNERGGRDRGRNERNDRNDRGRGGRERGRDGRRERDRDRDRGRGPDRPGERPADRQPERSEAGPPGDPSREAHRDLSRAGRHEPLPDEILPPDDDVTPKPATTGEDDGAEWALLDEFDADSGEKRRDGRRDQGEVEELGASSTGIDVIDVPREGRRRGLEPGLSLRDLLPFLRPPRHVIVAGVSTGAGHSRVAKTVFDGLKTLDRNLTLRDLDLLDHLSPRFRPGYVRSVLEDIQRRPALFGVPFETQPPSSAELMPADFDEFLKTLFDEKLEQALLDRRPEWIVLTHWLPLRFLETKAAAGVALPKIAVVASDPDFHEWWFSPVVKSWLVSNADFAQRLYSRGVEPDAVQVVGVPVDPAFRSGTQRDATIRQLGLKRDQPTVLFRPGGVGPGDRTLGIVKRLLESPVPMNLLVIAGKNETLREELEKLTPNPRSFLKAFAFVENIHDLMAASDVLVTRASAHTTAEAAAIGLPLVLLRPAPGVEERIADRLLAEGAAIIARDDLSLEVELLDLLRNRRRLRFMHERQLELAQPDGAAASIDRLTKLIR
jgi:processive 1,2-diacylglycerol beta-glucosyltransferase